MNILLINNFYYNRGGDCTYLFSLKDILQENGHEISILSMHHPLSFKSEFSKYFVSYINYEEEIKSTTLLSGLKVFKRTIYSREAKSRIEELIKDQKPDIAHIQNIHHHITPSIFSVLKKHHIPIIWTLHDYTIICPNTSFLCRGAICERCKKRKYFWPILMRCKKYSLLASTMAAIEATIHRTMKLYRHVDFYIAPSKFLQNKFIEYGFNKEKILNLNNFNCSVDCYAESIKEKDVKENYFMYLGRLSEEKGVMTLIDASIKIFSKERASNGEENNYKLKIVGDGPLKDTMESYIISRGVEDRIELVGHKTHNEAIAMLKYCKFLVLPSKTYENFPYSILEAFAMGKPVIGSRIGGIPELVKNWDTGLLFDPGSHEMLALKINFLIKHPEKAEAMGQNAKEYITGDISARNHYLRLMEIYSRAIKLNSLK